MLTISIQSKQPSTVNNKRQLFLASCNTHIHWCLPCTFLIGYYGKLIDSMHRLQNNNNTYKINLMTIAVSSVMAEKLFRLLQIHFP